MKNNKNIKLGLNILVGIIAIFIVGFLIKNIEVFKYMSSLDEFRTYIEGFGEKAFVVFFIVQLLSIIIAPIPSNVSATAGAMIFGFWESFIMTMLAIILGSVIVFFLSRRYGKAFIDKFVSEEVYEKYEGVVSSQKGEIAIALMLLLPFFPDDMINFIVGISNIEFKRYMIILLLTRPWGILFSSFVGVSNISIPMFGWVFIIVIAILLIKNSSKIENQLLRLIKSI